MGLPRTFLFPAPVAAQARTLHRATGLVAAAGDFVMFRFVAVPASSTGASYRFIERLQRSASEQTTTLGPQLGAGTKITTLAATPYLRLRAQIPAGTYTDGANAEFAQNANTVSVIRDRRIPRRAFRRPGRSTFRISRARATTRRGRSRAARASRGSVVAVSGNVLPFIGGPPVDNAQITGAGAQDSFIGVPRARSTAGDSTSASLIGPWTRTRCRLRGSAAGLMERPLDYVRHAARPSWQPPFLTPQTMTRTLFVIATTLLLARGVTAQTGQSASKAIPIRQLGKITAVARDTLGPRIVTRGLSDGRVLVGVFAYGTPADPGRRRVSCSIRRCRATSSFSIRRRCRSSFAISAIRRSRWISHRAL